MNKQISWKGEQIMKTPVEAGKMVEDVKVVIRDAENLLRASREDMSSEIQKARACLSQSVEAAKMSCKCAEEKVAEMVHKADEKVKANPYTTAAIALGAGLLLGAFLARKK